MGDPSRLLPRNLSPLEERWEAVEWCERTHRDTSTRVATGEIGLAQTRSGLALVRIGRRCGPSSPHGVPGDSWTRAAGERGCHGR